MSHGSTNRSAKPPCVGATTRPEATAPMQTPSSTGVSTLALEKIRPQRRWTASCSSSYVRNVKAEPRSTIPTSISETGICSTVMIRAKTGEKQVKASTTARISQT